MGRMSRRAFALAALSTLTLAHGAAAVPGGPDRGGHGPREAAGMRGVWVATVSNRDWPSRAGLSAAAQRAELIAHLDRAVRDRLNTVVLQVRPTADALWP